MTVAGGLLSKDLFVGLDEEVAHLCTAGEAPVLRAAAAALEEFAGLKSRGMRGRAQIIERYEEAKALAARLLGAESALDVAFLGHASDGLNAFARGLALEPGDTVVTFADEFPSTLLPWLARAGDGVVLRAVAPGDDPEGALGAAIDERTRVVAVSHVNYRTGVRVDLERIARDARAAGALLAVDASHSLGVIPIPLAACDVLVSCSYKFLLAAHGVGVFYANQERIAELTDRSLGWHSVEWPSIDDRSRRYDLKPGAERFELGNPSFVSVFVLREALKVLLSFDREACEAHVHKLGSRLHDGLAALGLTLLTPADATRRGPNVAFADADDQRIVEALADQGVLAWSGDGRVRFSLHAFSDSGDVDRALAALPSVLRR